MAENEKRIEEVILKKFSIIKTAIVFMLFNLFFGFIAGSIFFILIQSAAIAFEVTGPITGLFLLCFLGIPLLFSFVGFIFGLVLSLFGNFFLRIVSGIKLTFEEYSENKESSAKPDMPHESINLVHY